MNVVVVDSKGILRQGQVVSSRDRLFYSLAKFGSRIIGATMHFTYDSVCAEVTCLINVNVDGVGIVSVRRTCTASDDAINAAVDSIENKVAFKIDWKAWLNVEKFPTFSSALFESLKSGVFRHSSSSSPTPSSRKLPRGTQAT